MDSAENSSARRRVRIAVLNSHPIQYFAPLYAYLNAAPDLEVTALYLSEAMCASLPIVVTREIGCVPDLVQDGINGFTLATGDVDGLTRSLRCLIKNEDLRHQQGRASLARIQQWGFSQCLEGIRSALVGLISDLKTTTGAPTATMPSAVDAVEGR